MSELFAHCSDEQCGQVWIVAYLPMDLERAAVLLKRAACPRCGDTRPLAGNPIASPRDGQA